jgi:hypothetical protein
MPFELELAHPDTAPKGNGFGAAMSFIALGDCFVPIDAGPAPMPAA